MARRRLQDLAPSVREAAVGVIDDASGFVRSDPWRTVAIGAIGCLAVGLLLRGFAED
jgi:ElaB/YqjD/DUF883 family membrane-anchored ribosome-binding protein